MKSIDVLDDQLQKDDHFPQKGLLWEGRPMSKFTVTFLETASNFDVMPGSASILGFTFVVIALFSLAFYANEKWLMLVLTLSIGVLLLSIPDIVKYIRKSHTRYAFSKDKVYFRLWRWGKVRTHVIDLAEVGKITYEAYKNKSGVLHFLPVEQCNFYTYDFYSGKKRFYPTFELVPDVVALQKQLEDLRLRLMRKSQK